MIRLIQLDQEPIEKQLAQEKQLMEQSTSNWCLINTGSIPTIVMGISGKEEELIDKTHLTNHPIPLIRRFSGGGTVVVDENTLFVTFIFQKEAHPFPAYPEPIMRWGATFYEKAFDLPHFGLRENDYVIGDKKCGGNAQYIRKTCWLLHTSFLWDFTEHNMRYLLHPKKTPQYRAGRAHTEFLCRLKDHFPSKEECIARITRTLQSTPLAIYDRCGQDCKTL